MHPAFKASAGCRPFGQWIAVLSAVMGERGDSTLPSGTEAKMMVNSLKFTSKKEDARAEQAPSQGGGGEKERAPGLEGKMARQPSGKPN